MAVTQTEEKDSERLRLNLKDTLVIWGLYVAP